VASIGDDVADAVLAGQELDRVSGAGALARDVSREIRGHVVTTVALQDEKALVTPVSVRRIDAARLGPE
jgi:hypothetical protein